MNARIKRTNNAIQMIGFALLCVLLAADIALAQGSKLYTLTLDEVKTAIADELAREGAGDEVEIKLSGMFDKVVHRSARPVHLSVDHVDFDHRASRWEADVNIYEGDNIHEKLSLHGRYASMVEVPVLARRVYTGEVIKSSDVEWALVPENRLRNNVVFKLDRVVGKAPRRVIQPGRPIASHELEEPIVTQKGDLVQVAYNTPYMEIRTLGEAMEDAAIGDIISIRNTETSITLRAMVTAPGIAHIQDYAQLVQQQR